MFQRWFLAVLILLQFRGWGQQTVITGYVRDSLTHFAVSYATITNEGTRKKAQSDMNGLFHIPVVPGDLLQVTALRYNTDTTRYTSASADTLTIFLSPKGEVLPVVKVASRYSKYQVDSMERRANFDDMRGTSLNAVSAPSSGFGLSINLDRFFKKKYRNKKKEERRFENTEQTAYVNYRFSPHLVASYTGLKGDALKNFMYRFTPTYQWLRQHLSNEEVLYYINDKLKIYRSSQQGIQRSPARQ